MCPKHENNVPLDKLWQNVKGEYHHNLAWDRHSRAKKQRHGTNDNDTEISNDGGEASNDDYHELQPQILTLQMVIFPHLKSLWYC